MSRRQAPTAGQGEPTTDEIAAAFSTLLRAVGARATAPANDGRPEPLMTREEAGDWARVHPDTLDRWRTMGLRSYGTARTRRYRGSDILDFLAQLDGDAEDFTEIDERARRAAQKIQETVYGVRSQAG